jgi:protease I
MEALMADLSGLRVAVLATDGFEESELTEPARALRDVGAQVDIIAPKKGKIQGFHHFDKAGTVKVDRTFDEARAEEYDAVQLPGGALNADALRTLKGPQTFVRTMQDAGKPIAVICHGPWLLVSAGLVRGRTLTSYHTIQDDIRNAGGKWIDREVVADGNWVSSRQPGDIPAFNEAMLKLFSQVPAHAHS